MKVLPLFLLVFVLAALAPVSVRAEGEVKAELSRIVAAVQSKLREGKRTEPALAAELKQFDDLLAKHKGEKTEDVARVAMMKALLYVQVLQDEKKGVAMLQDVKRDFAGTEAAQNVDKVIAGLERQKEARKVQDALAVGTKFPDFAEKDLAGKPLSVAGYKGKVVLVDFWATWCGPCVAELPNVLKAYEKYHAKGFDILGISLDSDRSKLDSFLKQKNMPWAQYFDGQGWQNKLARKYGVNSIPATYLLDGEGKIIAKNLRGEALEKAVAKALGAGGE